MESSRVGREGAPSQEKHEHNYKQQEKKKENKDPSGEDLFPYPFFFFPHTLVLTEHFNSQLVKGLIGLSFAEKTLGDLYRLYLLIDIVYINYIDLYLLIL